MDDAERACRVCRAGEEPGAPLYRPCKCSGSISWIHQDCLESWLSVSRGHRCELCKHPFKWDKVYAAQAPDRLPVTLVVRHLVLGAVVIVQYLTRFLLAAFIWLAFLPYTILWSWRGLFHLAKGWGLSWTAAIQEVDWSMEGLYNLLQSSENATQSAEAASRGLSIAHEAAGETVHEAGIVTLNKIINGTTVSSSLKPKLKTLEQALADLIQAWSSSDSRTAGSLKAAIIPNPNSNSTTSAAVLPGSEYALPIWVPQSAILQRYAGTAIRSAVQQWEKHKSTLKVMAQDVFSGQIIVCCVVVTFIAAFLLRDWVIANQPQLAPVPPVQAENPAQRLPPDQMQENINRLLNRIEGLNEEARPEVHQGSQGGVNAQAAAPAAQNATTPTTYTGPPPRNGSSELSTSNNSERIAEESITAERPFGDEQPAASSDAAIDNRQRDESLEHGIIAESDDVGDPRNELDLAAPAALGPAVAGRAGNPRAVDPADDSDADEEYPWFLEPRADDRLPGDDLGPPDDMEMDDDIFLEADLQGIIEAVGIEGPLIALLQNVALVTLLVSCLLATAVWMPLMIGKTVAATNAQKLLLLPLNAVRLFTDPLADYAVTAVQRKNESEFAATPKIATRIYSAARSTLRHFSVFTPQPTHRQKLASSFAKHARSQYHQCRSYLVDNLSAAASSMKVLWKSMATGDSSLDRSLCIAVGYFVVFCAAGIYLKHAASNRTRNANATLYETVKQHLTLVKAAAFFFLEIVLFPTICGALFNLATLPLIPQATIASRLQHYVQAPMSTSFLTWLIGTNFMFLFAQAISIVRKCIRKGVLYFIRDPSDPDINPLREILDTPAIPQLKKIVRSLFLYGGIIITCFGMFPWLLSVTLTGIVPLRWDMTRPLSVIPYDLLFVLAIMPHTVGRARIRRPLRKLLRQWCELTAHQLRLSSFMLGKRRADEEGTHVRRSWRAWLPLKRAPVPSALFGNDQPVKTSDNGSSNAEVSFVRDGELARVVNADNVKIVPGKMLVRVNPDGTPTTEAGAEAIQAQRKEPSNTEAKFTIVYIPPNFTTRTLLFMFLLWLTGSIAIFLSACTPLLAGRFLLDLIFDEPLHDIYSVMVGLHVVLYGHRGYTFLARRAKVYYRYRRKLSKYALGAHPAREVMTRLSKIGAQLALLGIGGGMVLPLLAGITLHLYVLMPFETLGAPAGGMPTISLSMDWAYGVVGVSLACSFAKLVRPTGRLGLLLKDLKTEGLVRSASQLNAAVGQSILGLSVALAMPVSVTFTHRLITRMLWRSVLQGGEAPPSSQKSLAYVFRAALLCVSCTAAAVALAKPVVKLGRKWVVHVWESEYVIQRKLRNIDDPAPASPTTPTVGAWVPMEGLAD